MTRVLLVIASSSLRLRKVSPVLEHILDSRAENFPCQQGERITNVSQPTLGDLPDLACRRESPRAAHCPP